MGYEKIRESSIPYDVIKEVNNIFNFKVCSRICLQED